MVENKDRGARKGQWVARPLGSRKNRLVWMARLGMLGMFISSLLVGWMGYG